MEGEGHFEFKKHKRAGRCPVLYCRCDSRANGEGRKPSTHRLCSKHAKLLCRLRDPAKILFHEMRGNAKRRGKEWSLTLEQFRQIVSQQDYLDNRGCTRHCLHLDRIDNTRGYHIDNIQIITCGENVAKGNKERRKGFVNIPEDNYPF